MKAGRLMPAITPMSAPSSRIGLEDSRPIRALRLKEFGVTKENSSGTISWCSERYAPQVVAMEVQQVTRRRLLAKAASPIRYSDHLEGDALGMKLQACELGLEGIVSK